MTAPNADQVIAAHLGGYDPGTGGWLPYQSLPVLGRTVWGINDAKGPFRTDWGHGPQPNTSASYDAITGIGQQIVGRHVDPYGNVWELHKVWHALVYWFLDGCPTPLPQSRLAYYMKMAGRLRPWPTGYKGAMTGEAQHDYAPFPTSPQVPLDRFADPANDTLSQ